MFDRERMDEILTEYKSKFAAFQWPKGLKNENEGMEWFLSMLKYLDYIRDKSKKIGNAQRMYFQYFFRELFNAESDSYLKLENAVENGYKKYLSQV